MHIINNKEERALDDLFEGPSKRVLLIEPPFYNLFGYERRHYPITLTLVGSFLKEKGHDVKVYDADKPLPYCLPYSRTQARENYYRYSIALEQDNHKIWNEIKEEISKFNPDIIGLTSVTSKIDSANKIAKISRDVLGKGGEIILGGPHVQGMRDSYPDYDFGENYDFIVTHIPGLIDRKPDKSLLSSSGTYSKKDLSVILTATGCPHSCTYCCNSIPNKKIYFRNIDSIEEELKEIKESTGDEEMVTIADDSFFSYTKRFHEIGNLFKKIGLTFSGDVRVDELSPEKIEEFIKYGGRRIYVGIESGSQKVLDKIKKKMTIEKILNGSRLINDSALPWSAFFIVGFPFETLDDLKHTEEIIYKTQPTFVSINRFTPYPGTELWREYYSDSKLEFKDLFQLSDKNVTMLSDEIEDYIDLMFKKFDEYNKERAQIKFISSP